MNSRRNDNLLTVEACPTNVWKNEPMCTAPSGSNNCIFVSDTISDAAFSGEPIIIPIIERLNNVSGTDDSRK